MTWAQNFAVKALQVFLDQETVDKQVFSNTPNPPNLLKKVWPSQLEIPFGGTAKKVTQFWPPIFPPITENIDEKSEKLNCVPRPQYIQHLKSNPRLTRMPRQMRMDLPPLPDEFIQVP